MRARVRSLLLLLLLGALLLEALSLIRAPLLDAVHGAYPAVGLTSQGDVVYYDIYFRERSDGTNEVVRQLDTARNTAALLDMGVTRVIADLAFGGRGVQRRADLDFDYARLLRAYAHAREPRFTPFPPLEQLAQGTLQSIEATRRGIEIHERREKTPVAWNVEHDRLVCRERTTGRILAGLGPDGYATGEKAGEGARFSRVHADHSLRQVEPGKPPRWLLLEWDEARIHVVSMPPEQAAEGSLAADSTEPVALALETRPLRPLAAAAPADRVPYCAIVGSRALAYLDDGSVIADVALEPGEEVTSTSGALLVRADVAPDYFGVPKAKLDVFGVETALSPTHAADERRRLRLFRPGQPEIVRDVLLTPTRAGEVLLANLAAAFVLLRPVPLVLASAVSPLPADRHGTWWWREAWLAGGSYWGWLVPSLALAGFLAWRARRAARERCATIRGVRFWTAAVLLLGPVGLLWMKLVLPRVPVEAVGNARRAVNLDASPSASAPWPEPKRQGIEVFS